MPKFLCAVRYSADGARGVAQDGGSSRARAAKELLESVGGNLECFYFAFGDVDMYAIGDFPDDIDAAAVGLAVAQSAGSTMAMTQLLTPEEMDTVVSRRPIYREPGQ
jgi:uncharacterized protein with GYD domain